MLHRNKKKLLVFIHMLWLLLAASCVLKIKIIKKGIFTHKAMEKRLSKNPNLYKIIKKSVENVNNLPSVKYKQTTDEIGKNH